MKKVLISVLFVLLVCSLSFSQDGTPRQWRGTHRGDYPDVYTCFVATTVYCVIPSSLASISADFEIENDGVDAWFKWDSTHPWTPSAVTISTGNVALPTNAQTKNGYITGEEGYLQNGTSWSPGGRAGGSLSLFFRTESATGTKLRVTLYKRYNLYPK